MDSSSVTKIESILRVYIGRDVWINFNYFGENAGKGVLYGKIASVGNGWLQLVLKNGHKSIVNVKNIAFVEHTPMQAQYDSEKIMNNSFNIEIEEALEVIIGKEVCINYNYFNNKTKDGISSGVLVEVGDGYISLALNNGNISIANISNIAFIVY
ncbi:MAG: hypothetical protein K2K91_04460 [Ruminococcus sp.]|nr:hypothetical protein [Ruminococcus sp.]MDE7098662.1 hypothetical protein [Ruminococcus sp.]